MAKASAKSHQRIPEAEEIKAARYPLGRIRRHHREMLQRMLTEHVSAGELLTIICRDVLDHEVIDTAAMLKLPSGRVIELERSARRRLANIDRRAARDAELAASLLPPKQRNGARR